MIMCTSDICLILKNKTHVLRLFDPILKNDAFACSAPPHADPLMSLSKLYGMRRSSGDASFPKNISEPRPAMVLIFKEYNLCHFEKCRYTILKNSKPQTYWIFICVYIFVKRTSPAFEAESNSGELHDNYSCPLCPPQQVKDIVFLFSIPGFNKVFPKNFNGFHSQYIIS